MEYVRQSKIDNHERGYIKTYKYMIRMLGMTEALIFSEIKSWCATNAEKTLTHLHEGKIWMYRSFEDWADELAVSVSTVKRAIKTLRKLGIIYVQKFSKHRYYQVNWYSINRGALDFCKAMWFAKGHPSVMEKSMHKQFLEAQENAFNLIDKGQLKLEDELLRLEQIISEGQIAPIGKNLSEGQIEPIREGQIEPIITEATTEANNIPSEISIENQLIDEYLIESIDESIETDIKDSEISKWIRLKNGCGITAIRKFEKELREEKKYDDSGNMVSALELYEADLVYRSWCDFVYGETHQHFKNKSLPVGTEKTIAMITDCSAFYSWQDKRRGAVESIAIDVVIDDGGYEYDVLFQGLDMEDD